LVPYRCPSPDRDTECDPSEALDCEIKCHGIYREGVCFWNSWDDNETDSRHLRAAVAIAPPFPGAVVGSHDAYIKGYDMYRGTLVYAHNGQPMLSIQPHQYVSQNVTLYVMPLILLCVSLLGVAWLLKILLKYATKLHQQSVVPGMIDLESLEDEGYVPEAKPEGPLRPSRWEVMSVVVSVITMLAALAMLAKADDFDMETFEQYQERTAFFNYTLPSACSCSKPGEVTSQLRCVLGCQDSIRIGERSLTMHFDLDQQCQDKYLLVLTYLEERSCHQCKWGDNVCERMMYTSNWSYVYPKVTHGWGQCDCALDGYSQTMILWDYDLYPAQYCDVARSSHEYISGLEDPTAYSASIDSTLLAQSSYARVWVKGMLQFYKVGNGGIDSQRAFLINRNDVDNNGILKSTSYVYSQLLKQRTIQPGYCLDNEYVYQGLEEFRPQVFDQKCDVDVTFKTMRCFTLEESCRGEYREFENLTMFRALKPGMCNGKYVTSANWESAPAGLQKCGGCIMDKTCDGPLPTPGNCSYTFYYESMGNTTSLVNRTITQAVNNAMPWVAGVLSIIMVAVVAALAILLLRCLLASRNYKQI
jgi:hypothetical protein